MRLIGMTTLLVSGAVLRVAGAAAGNDLVTGDYVAIDTKNSDIRTRVEVLTDGLPGSSSIDVNGECTASTGERVRFEFEANVIDKSNITGKTATLDQKQKVNPAVVIGIIPGICDGDLGFDGLPCFFGSECGLGDCDLPAPTAEVIDCDKVRVSAKVDPLRKTKFKADASKCTTVSAPLVAAVEAACKGNENQGVTVKASGAGKLQKIKISGNGDTIEP